MKNFINKYLVAKVTSEYQLQMYNDLDVIFYTSQEIITTNLIILQQARILLRAKKITQGREKYFQFVKNWTLFQEDIRKITPTVDDANLVKALHKIIKVIEELIEKSTSYIPGTIIPSPKVNLLETEDISCSNIDGIIHKVKDYLNKLSQVYVSVRIRYLLFQAK